MKTIRIPVAVTFCAFAAACGPRTTDNNRPNNVFGRDNREIITSMEAPYSAVGRIEEAGCTATLIGQSIIVTAAHCLWSETSQTAAHRELTFSLAVRNGTPKAQAKITGFWIGSTEPESRRVTDFAVATLDRSLAAHSAPVAVQVRTSETPSFSTNLVAYSEDIDNGGNPAIHRNCKIHETAGAKWFHECDGKSGMSGGPMLEMVEGTPTVVAVAVSEYRRGAPGSIETPTWTRELSNVAVSASEFAPLAYEALSRFDNRYSAAGPLLGLNYLSVADLNNPDTQLPVPNPTEPNPGSSPGAQPDPSLIFQGNWSLTDSSGYYLVYPQYRLAAVQKTRLAINDQLRYIAALKTTLTQRYGPSLQPLTNLNGVTQCLTRLDFLVAQTGSPNGTSSDYEIQTSTYSCIQNHYVTAYNYWSNLTGWRPEDRRSDVSLWNAIFLNHRYVFLDLYNGRRDI